MGGSWPQSSHFVAMTAQGGGAATRDRRQHFPMLSAEPAAPAFEEALSGGANQISHLQRRPLHLGRPGIVGWQVFSSG